MSHRARNQVVRELDLENLPILLNEENGAIDRLHTRGYFTFLTESPNVKVVRISCELVRMHLLYGWEVTFDDQRSYYEFSGHQNSHADMVLVAY